MYAFVKLGCSPDCDGFEANFNSIVQINQFTNNQASFKNSL